MTWPDAAVTLGGMAILALYEIFRQFKREKAPGLVPFLERNMPRIIIAAVIIQGFAPALISGLQRIIK